MNKTKDRILECALRLFNERGISQVSLRTISTELEISIGNLTYHFKKREDLIDALYIELVGKLDSPMKKEVKGEKSLELLFELSSLTISCFYEYRFLMLDFVYISRNHDMIRNHYKQLMKERENQYEGLIQTLIEAEYLREEMIEREYSYLFKNLRLVSDFWLSAASIDSNTEVSKKDSLEGINLLKHLIFPYLTSKGRSIFFQLN